MSKKTTKKAAKPANATGAANAAAQTPKIRAATRRAAKVATAARAAASGRPLSGLDAAAKVLAGAGRPMRVREIVNTMIERGLWKSGGKTPHATIYSAMIREIAVKKSAARFRKTERGLFAFNRS